MAILYIFIIIAASTILVKSAHWIIKALDYIAKYLRTPEFVVAFILAGIATSFPELFVGISSAINKVSVLSLSNILGSNIANITIILGLTIILIKGIKSESRIIKRNIIYVFLLIIYSILLASDGLLSRVDGVGLLILFILYNLILFFQSQEFTKTEGYARRKDLIKNILLLVISLSLLLISAHIIVKASTRLAIELNISLFLIGLFLIAIGTSLPELIFGIQAAKAKHKDMILGNILGSLASNSTAVLGITAIIHPIMIGNTGLLLNSGLFLLVAYILFAIFLIYKNKITLSQGFVLLFFYICFIIIQFLLK